MKLWIALLLVYLLGVLGLFTWFDVRALAATEWGPWVLGVGLLPLVLIARVVLEVVVEAGLYAVVGGVFKAITLFQIDTEWTHPGMAFPWHGLARDRDGRWVASENLMFGVVIAVFAGAGVAAWMGFDEVRAFWQNIVAQPGGKCS